MIHLKKKAPNKYRWKKSGESPVDMVNIPLIYKGFSTIQTVLFSPVFGNPSTLEGTVPLRRQLRLLPSDLW